MDPYSKNYSEKKVVGDREILSKKENRILYKKVVKYYHNELLNDEDRLSILVNGRKRKIESIRQLEIGLVKNTQNLITELLDYYEEESLIQSGLFKKITSNDDKELLVSIFDYWENNNVLLYPIYKNNEVYNIKSKYRLKNGLAQGIYIDSEKAGNNYHYILNQDALTQDDVYICEGENDMMAMIEKGFSNVVAMLGNVKSSIYKELNSAEDKNIYLCFDNDDAGKEYVYRFVKNIKNKNIKLYKANYLGKDPDDALKNGNDINFELIEKEDFLDKHLMENTYSEVINELNKNWLKVLIKDKIYYIEESAKSSRWLDRATFYNYISTLNIKAVELWDQHAPVIKGVTVYFSRPDEDAQKFVLYNQNKDSYRLINERDVQKAMALSLLSGEDLYLNLSYGFVYKPGKFGREKEVKWLLDFIKKYTCSNDEVIFDYFIRWLADMFQRPNMHVGTSPVLIGPEGSGKGTVVERFLFKLISATHTVVLRDNKAYTGAWNDRLENRLLVYLDEAVYGGSSREGAALLGLIGNPTLPVSKKFKSGYSVPFTARFIFSSNSDVPIKIGETNRRYFFPECSKDLLYSSDKENNKRIAAIIDQFTEYIENDEILSEFVDYMMNVDTSPKVFNRWFPPVNDRAIEMKKSTISSYYQWLINCIENQIENPEYDFRFDAYYKEKGFLVPSRIYDRYREYCEKYLKNKYENVLNQNLFARKFSDLLGKENKKQMCVSASYLPRGFYTNEDIIRAQLIKGRILSE